MQLLFLVKYFFLLYVDIIVKSCFVVADGTDKSNVGVPKQLFIHSENENIESVIIFYVLKLEFWYFYFAFLLAALERVYEALTFFLLIRLANVVDTISISKGTLPIKSSCVYAGSFVAQR